MSWFVHLIASAPGTPTPTPTVLYVVAAALMGGLIPTSVAAYRRWKRGPIEDDETISRIVNNEMQGLKDLLGEYRVEVEVTKRQLDDYRGQLREVTLEMARSQVRIAHLEDELRTTRDGRDRVLRELSVLTQERDGLAQERERLAKEAMTLRARVKALEDFTAMVHSDEQPKD